MPKFKITVLPGDGIGPEVCQEAIKVLRAVERRFGHSFEFQTGLIGGAAYDQHQSHFPQETKDLCRWGDAVLFGSIGGPVEEQDRPRWKNCERDSLLAIRQFLELKINIRPARVWSSLRHLSVLKPEVIPPEGLEVVTFRELSEGLYFGDHQITNTPAGKVATDTCQYHAKTIEIISRFCFAQAAKLGKSVASVDKANVLDTSRLWRAVVDEISAENPSVPCRHWLVDNAVQQLVKHPEWFDFILTENLFGDILSDLTATFSGSLGLLPSASLSVEGFGLYEPSGGSAPHRAGKNMINPIAQILCGALMLRYSFGLEPAAQAIESAVDVVLERGLRTYDLYREQPNETSVSTTEMGDAIAQQVTDSR